MASLPVFGRVGPSYFLTCNILYDSLDRPSVGRRLVRHALYCRQGDLPHPHCSNNVHVIGCVLTLVLLNELSYNLYSLFSTYFILLLLANNIDNIKIY